MRMPLPFPIPFRPLATFARWIFAANPPIRCQRNLLSAVLLALLTACGGGNGGGSSPDPNPSVFSIALEQELPSTCAELYLSAHADASGRAFVYVAAKEGGLKVFDRGTPAALKKTIPIAQLGGLHAMNLSQTGNLLLVALGNHFGTNAQAAGVALVDVADPANPVVRSVWSDGALQGGCGIALSDGRYVYMGAMRNGVVVLDALNPAAPAFVSRFVPDLAFPDATPDPTKINARGMALAGSTLYLAYDAGGLRILDASDRAHLRETGRYSNPVMNGKPRAYNNVVVDGGVAYVAVDYCGLETLNVANPAAIQLLAWWNPWACQVSAQNWFTSDGHANELALDPAKKLLFISTGKSDLQILDVSTPSAPAWLQEYGGTANGLGTWGVSIQGGKAYLTYVCAFIPFTSNWTGVRVLTYTR